jgi:putative FmdB family regulatory protein
MKNMPIYEYKCSRCGHKFEVKQKITDKPVKICPNCGGSLQKIFFPAGIIFKGDGFYITESRKEKEKMKEKNQEIQKEGEEKK